MAPDSGDHTRNVSVVDRFLHQYFYQWGFLLLKGFVTWYAFTFPVKYMWVFPCSRNVSSSVSICEWFILVRSLLAAFHLYMSLVKDGVLLPIHILVTWYFIHLSSFVERLLKKEHFFTLYVDREICYIPVSGDSPSCHRTLSIIRSITCFSIIQLLSLFSYLVHLHTGVFGSFNDAVPWRRIHSVDLNGSLRRTVTPQVTL